MYYVPYEKNKDGSPIAARGKLFSAHQYIRRQQKNFSSEPAKRSGSGLSVYDLQSQNSSEVMSEGVTPWEVTRTDFVPTKNVMFVRINFH